MISPSEYKTLYEFVNILSPEYSREQILERATEFLYRTIGAENVITSIENVTCAKFSRTEHVEISKAISIQVRSMKTPIIIPNVATDFTLKGITTAQKVNCSACTTPIMFQQLIIGTITIFTQLPIREKSEFVQEIGFQIGRVYAMKNALEGARTNAITDNLTGLYNKSYFNDVLNHEIEKAKIKEKPTTLVIIDLDNFKQLNDTEGHIAGDEALKRIGLIIQSTMPTGINCRYGGEEFSILLPEASQAMSKEVSEKLRETIEKEFAGKITASIGTITSINSTLTPLTMIQEADAAMYEAKRKGKNKVVQYISLDKTLGIINTENL
ncbi:GGDEF domain-containing protein [Candidatus Woesearchaeota archaeon]|nr:GGDEF domain-containing protein [Candidatus Woesearchaeota archaeon]